MLKKLITFAKNKILNVTNNDKNKIELLSLSSNKKLTGEKYDVYRDSLKNSLYNDDVFNIAITGKYGSGKSSIIDTFFGSNDSKGIVPLKVSFATFDNNKVTNSDDTNTQDMYISSNIINQIIYQIPRNKIPLTNFKIKKPVPFIKKFLLSSFIMFVCIAIFKNDVLTRFHFYNAFLLFFLIIFLIIIWNILNYLDISKIQINVKNIQTDINRANDDLFEKYADEVIYLFEKYEKKTFKNDPQVLIIEDLDRFNNISIFEKLRELNIKLNNSSKKHWIFIYLLKDDVFHNSNDRVKFFDEIIPVIPFITTNNSFDKLKELFTSESSIDTRLLYNLSAYIDDYRIIINIKNEYEIFNSLVHNSNLNQLLALLAYKNLYPDDFDDTQNGEGCLGMIMKKFKYNIQNQICEIDKEIDNINSNYDKNHAENEAEFLYLYCGKRSNLSIEINSYIYSYENFKDINSIQNAILNNEVYIRFNNKKINYNDFKNENVEYKNELSNFIDSPQKIISYKKEKKIKFY
ncbi:hypothetical protein M2S00_05865 [Apilactobacillus sp. TMW 2.2459]|uniref:YobI family P-loop NTPase n=1 Tax=Apilactobacillus xinyiensis TaxID=2841032 RepID=UPI00200D941A|nr:hypothetical protein [Apilactobacillus xinyiensis]MCL0312632.1 hypothetical protein [Apilactobacillus xinyiensis]